MRKTVAGGLVAASVAGAVAVGAVLGPIGSVGAQGTDETPPREATPSHEWHAFTSGHGDTDDLERALDSLVDDKTLTREQADAVLERLEQAHDEARDEFRSEREARRAERHATTNALAALVDMPFEELIEALGSGRSLAEIAGDDVDAVVELLVEQANERIDAALEAELIDEAKAEELRAGVVERVTERIEREGSWFSAGFDDFDGWHGPRSRGGIGEHPFGPPPGD